MTVPFVRFSPRERTWLCAALAQLCRQPVDVRIARLERESLRPTFGLFALAQRLADAQLGKPIDALSAEDCAALRAGLRAVRQGGADAAFSEGVSGILPLDSSHVSSLLIRLGD